MAIKLPPRRYLTLPELAIRWECTENEVRELIVSSQLKPSYIINHVAHKVRFFETSDDAGDFWQMEPIGSVEDDDGKLRSKLYNTEGSYYLLHPDVTSSLDCHFFYFSTDKEHVKGADDKNICFMLAGKGSLGQGITLDMVFAHGMVMMSEVVRVEEQNSESPEAEKSIETRKHNAPSVAASWPWGSHHTKALGHLEAAAKKFWVIHDPTEPSSAPTNQQVADWLRKERGVAKSLAKNIASILRQDGLVSGPRKNIKK